MRECAEIANRLRYGIDEDEENGDLRLPQPSKIAAFAFHLMVFSTSRIAPVLQQRGFRLRYLPNCTEARPSPGFLFRRLRECDAPASCLRQRLAVTKGHGLLSRARQQFEGLPCSGSGWSSRRHSLCFSSR